MPAAFVVETEVCAAERQLTVGSKAITRNVHDLVEEVLYKLFFHFFFKNFQILINLQKAR
jgi:hypothetical protein